MRFLLFGAVPRGPHDFYRRLLEAAEFVVGLDAGAEACARLGRVPDVALGDFDSAEPGAAARLEELGARILEHPARKDFSDLDLGVSFARENGATSVTMTAVTGERLDHTLAALGSLLACAGLDGAILEPSLSAWPLDSEVAPSLVLTGTPGATFSVFALGGPAVVDIEGAEYPLQGRSLAPLTSLGLSNRLAEGICRVSFRSGSGIVLTSPLSAGERPIERKTGGKG